MAHGLNSVLKRSGVQQARPEGKTGVGSRRIFAPHFKLQVLDSYRNDADCRGNQRATARKYGIHRRQIQKWLQVENTLRSSVNGSGGTGRKCGEGPTTLGGAGAARLLGDDRADRQRVPDADGNNVVPTTADEHAPLDFTTRGTRFSTPSVMVLLSASTPIDLSIKRPTTCMSPLPPRSPSPVHHTSPFIHRLPPPPPQDPDVWDLSMKKIHEKPLFKPYLDVVKDEELERSPPPQPCCSAIPSCDTYHFNNNNVNDIKTEYGSYSIQELQPKSIMNYYYPSFYPPADVSATYVYEEPTYHNLQPLKRHTYSLDFKLSAIDCYYQDTICRGNQRAVASKYNVHRRQVQKWLKQEEELRTKNNGVRQMHAVR